MKKTHVILYTASVIGFYLSLVMLYVNTASAAGAALLCTSILALAAAVFFHWKDLRSVHRTGCAAKEAAAVSC